MKKLIEIADKVYIDALQIKIIFDNKKYNAKIKDLIARCKENDKLRERELEKKKRLEERNLTYDEFILYKKRYFAHSSKTDDGTYRFIITKNNELHSTNYSLEEIKRRCLEVGINLVDMSELALVSLSYIDGIYDVSSNLVSSLPQALNAEMTNFQFVLEKTKKINTVIWLKTNELIRISKSVNELKMQIDNFEDLN